MTEQTMMSDKLIYRKLRLGINIFLTMIFIWLGVILDISIDTHFLHF